MTTAEAPAPHGLERLRDVEGLRRLPREERVAAICHLLRLELQRLLAVPPAHRLSADLPLGSQGLDAINALSLERAIRTVLRTEVPAEALRASTVGEVAERLAEATGPHDEQPSSTHR